MEPDPKEIRRILKNDDFNHLIDAMRVRWTKKILATSTTGEEAEEFRQEYHALERVLSTMRSVANAPPGEDNDDG